ncbi:MAG: rRNA pseudouridine synthase [Clostridium sp.]|uniref:pseudouridine synthase n=1 Tax=Clostridium sp. DSM 8431 TaxID=1761781 RepID=UPI0008E02373|nr:pseudouridine synthase [Clostridium sp. DSM 8431]MCR4943294.1 rRNA pseudouridine synthase [Clostridium sp.]SFU35167.1 ribosomal large subunit pseudouridine synthase B [Clostridium sp. DSM 8431]
MEERLQKYMASCGVASRRKCEELILDKKVKVNGLVIEELGTKVTPGKDVVEYNGKIIEPEKRHVYIMLNKPEGIITSAKDEKGRETVVDLINVDERIYPIGRLDYDSSGLIILTNDGEVYNKIIHPREKIMKKYIVVAKGEFSSADLNKFQKGIDIGGYVTAPAKIKVLKYEDDKSTVEIGIHEGKNRQIRRMCSAVGHEVLALKRVQIGEIKLGYLKRGEYRDLTKAELDYIKTL